MDKLRLRPILLGAFSGVLSLYALSLYLDASSLQKQNHNLLEESRGLERTLDHVLKQHNDLLLSIRDQDREKQNMKDALESLKKQNESIQFSLKKNETKIESIQEEKSYLEEMLINKSKQIEILNGQRAQAPDGTAPSETPETSASFSETSGGQKDDELKRLNEQNRVLQEKLDRLYKTTNAKINEINIAKIALEETVSTAKKKIEDEWNTVNLGSVTTSAVPDRQPDTASSGGPKSEGHVLAINNEHGFVVIDLGKVDNLPSDATLEVKKNGHSIATLSVLEIRDVMAACNIKDLQTGQKIDINDPVSILR
jgi:hypothetical protein